MFSGSLERLAKGAYTAALGKVTTSDPTLVFNFTVGTSGEDLNLNSVSITAADVVSISSMTLTAPAA